MPMRLRRPSSSSLVVVAAGRKSPSSKRSEAVAEAAAGDDSAVSPGCPGATNGDAAASFERAPDSSTTHPEKTTQARQLALKRVLDQINHKHGAGAVMRLGQQPMQM